jgi:hypothetical protein
MEGLCTSEEEKEIYNFHIYVSIFSSFARKILRRSSSKYKDAV